MSASTSKSADSDETTPADGLGDLHAQPELLPLMRPRYRNLAHIDYRKRVWKTRRQDRGEKFARVTGSSHRIDSQARFWPVGATRLPPQAVRSSSCVSSDPSPPVVAVLLLTSAAAGSWRRSRVKRGRRRRMASASHGPEPDGSRIRRER